MTLWSFSARPEHLLLRNYDRSYQSPSRNPALTTKFYTPSHQSSYRRTILAQKSTITLRMKSYVRLSRRYSTFKTTWINKSVWTHERSAHKTIFSRRLSPLLNGLSCRSRRSPSSKTDLIIYHHPRARSVRVPWPNSWRPRKIKGHRATS